jgi:hypothetical protein
MPPSADHFSEPGRLFRTKGVTLIRNKKKLVGAALAVAAIAFTGAASTASNTVAAGAGRLGFSDTIVTGGTINAINYTLDNTMPGKVIAVKINVDDLTPAAVVRVQLSAEAPVNTDPDILTEVISCVRGLETLAPVADDPGTVGVDESVPGKYDYDCTVPTTPDDPGTVGVDEADPVIPADKLEHTYVAIS